MNLKQLFEMQRKLDERIIEEKGLEGQDLLPEKILALQVELGELANEWRGFKFWSKNRKPNTRDFLNEKEEKLFVELHGWSPNEMSNPLLEEYVDCLHFILSIGLELELADEDVFFLQDEIQIDAIFKKDIIEQFSYLFYCSAHVTVRYNKLFNAFVGLGEWLGFTWEQIEQAYKEKNATNHLRQSNGY